MFKRMACLLLFLGVVGAQGANDNHQEYRMIPVKHQAWGKKFLKSMGTGTIIGGACGLVCAGFDIHSPLYRFPIHWVSAYAARKIACALAIENYDDEGKPANRQVVETTSLLSSWGVWLAMIIPSLKGTLYH